MTSIQIDRSGLGAYALFCEMLEMTVSDIAKGMILGYCDLWGMMLPPQVMLSDKTGAEYQDTAAALKWLRSEEYQEFCDGMKLHPGEVMREAKRRYGQGYWGGLGPVPRGRRRQGPNLKPRRKGAE